MSVKDLLNQKAAEREAKREEERRRNLREAEAHRDALTKAIDKIAEDLEGLDVTPLERGQWKIRYSRYTVYVECRYHLDEVRYCDEMRPEKQWCLKVGIGTRAINVPEMYCGVDSFAENLSNFLLSLT